MRIHIDRETGKRLGTNLDTVVGFSAPFGIAGKRRVLYLTSEELGADTRCSLANNEEPIDGVSREGGPETSQDYG